MLPESDSAIPVTESVMAHVLFMDIVGCSKRFTDDQRKIVDSLQTKVRASSEYRKALERRELISLPTGDGMALVFLNDIEAPLRCAIEIARALRSDPSFQVRMGIHSGPVFIVEDINGQRNVSGAGINRAQRVMDCGDADHILLSDAMADVLRQFRHWSGRIRDIGECRVKDGWQHVWSYYDGDLGTVRLPQKSKRRMQRRRAVVAGGAALLGLSALAIALLVWSGRAGPAPSTPERSITYSIVVKPPAGPARVYSREMIFPPHYGLKFRFRSGQHGFLYLVNEGPETAKGRTWHWLFPYPAFNNGRADIAAGETVTVPAQPSQYYELDEKSGRENLILAWSDRPIPELDDIRRQVFASSPDGTLTRQQAGLADTFFQRQNTEVAAVNSDNGTTLRSRDPYLIKSIVLEHL